MIKKSESGKQTVTGYTCGLSCTVLVQGKAFCFPLNMWVYSSLSGAKQQVCAEPGTELVKLIFSSSSRETDNMEEAATASNY